MFEAIWGLHVTPPLAGETDVCSIMSRTSVFSTPAR